jgi:hypothetical protein
MTLLADQPSQFCLVPQRDWAKSVRDKKSGGSYLPPLVGSKEPVLSSALLTATLLTATLFTAALLTAALLTATLFFTLALLTFTLLCLSILLLSALLSGGRGFARFIWILLCVHEAFLCY